MRPFKNFKSKSVPLNRSNVDTDQIIPKQFLKLLGKSGFGKFLFYNWRYNEDGSPRADFVLNDPKYHDRHILLARENFGSGSSREHAVWAISDYGFRVVIAPSFSDIFYGNCFNNGILPIATSPEVVDYLFKSDHEIEVNLAEQQFVMDDRRVTFEIDTQRKRQLLEGLDAIALTEQYAAEISHYEQKDPVYRPRLI